MKIVMTRTIGASEDIGIHASSANTKRAHPSSRLLSLCSRRQTYGPGWSPLADPPPRPCDEASSACIAECSPGEEAVKQSILQDHHLDTSADEKRRENTQKDSQQTKTVDAGWAWVVLPAAFYIIVSRPEMDEHQWMNIFRMSDNINKLSCKWNLLFLNQNSILISSNNKFNHHDIHNQSSFSLLINSYSW